MDLIIETEPKLNKAGQFKASLSPLVAEVVGAGLMKSLGLGAPEDIRLVDKAEAREAIATGEWVPKVYTDGRLKAVDELGLAESNILIKRIPGAISLYNLRVKHGICGREIRLSADVPQDSSIIEKLVYTGGQNYLLNSWGKLILQGSGTCHYIADDFILPLDRSKIQEVVEWDSAPMLAIHAARLFLGCSAGHAGNILVDADGKLYSIDHESCAHTNGEELELLFDNVQRDTRAWRSLAGVASLSHEDIASLFSAIPDDAHWPLGDKAKTVDYFCGRLTYWRWRYAGN